MPELQTGDTAPDFTAPATTPDGGETTLSLPDYKGRKVILYFYPKDDTPGCTKESCGFRDSLKDFEKLDAVIIGVSKDSIAKHHKFTAKHSLNFPLISDEGGDVCEQFGVWKEKSMYGKTYMGIERSTFLIDENGKIAHIWRKVKVKDHIEAVGKALSELNKKAA